MEVDLQDSTVDVVDLVGAAAFLVLVTVIAVGVYRSMEKPRLRLTPADQSVAASRRDIIQYALSVPPLILGWYLFFFVLILLAPGNPSPDTLLLMPLAVVVAVRFLAHWSLTSAYHLSSVVPMVIVTSILLGEGLPSEQELTRYLDELSRVDLSGSAFVAAILLEYAFTAFWYWRRRRGHGQTVAGPRPPETPGSPDPSMAPPSMAATITPVVSRLSATPVAEIPSPKSARSAESVQPNDSVNPHQDPTSPNRAAGAARSHPQPSLPQLPDHQSSRPAAPDHQSDGLAAPDLGPTSSPSDAHPTQRATPPSPDRPLSE